LKKYEIFKIWSQWLIRHLSQVSINYHPIPGPGIEDDHEIFKNLHEKGLSEDSAKCFIDQLIQRVKVLYQKYHQFKTEQLTQLERMVCADHSVTQQILTHGGQRWYIYHLGELYVKYDQQLHDRLLTRYCGDNRCMRFALFEMGFNYYLLDGHSFQWCVPPKVMSVLDRYLVINGELFASPINSHFSPYYSLFQIDCLFGASGQFFQIKELTEGTFEVNPPFIEQLFIDSSRIIIDCLEQAQETGRDLLFIYLMPNWSDSQGYQRLKDPHNGYLIDEIILPEKGHFYYQYSKHKLIIANFETHLLVVGTSAARGRWTREIHDQIMDHSLLR
jgi:phosphorylated CTD-interacting factor 1